MNYKDLLYFRFKEYSFYGASYLGVCDHLSVSHTTVSVFKLFIKQTHFYFRVSLVLGKIIKESKKKENYVQCLYLIKVTMYE